MAWEVQIIGEERQTYRLRYKSQMPVTEIEGETGESSTGDSGQIEHAMAAAISELEAVDPLSLEEARQ